MQAHTARAGWRRAGLPGARLLVLLAAVAGLFAMHGMSDHGVMHHGASAGHDTTTVEIAAALADHSAHGGHDAHGGVGAAGDDASTWDAGPVTGAAASVAVDGVRVASAAVAGVGEALDGGLHAAMGLCLAILAGAAAVALRRIRLHPHPLATILGSITRDLLPAHARAPDPPDLHALCIQRC